MRSTTLGRMPHLRNGWFSSFKEHRAVVVVAFSPDFALDFVARRNEQLEQFYDAGISIDLLRSKIVKKRCSKDLKALKCFPEG